MKPRLKRIAFNTPYHRSGKGKYLDAWMVKLNNREKSFSLDSERINPGYWFDMGMLTDKCLELIAFDEEKENELAG
jgi:hypothetical protein